MNPEEIFFELGIELHWCCGRYKNRRVRYLEREGVFQVGEHDNTFDRWSNSVDFEFDIWQPKGMRQFIRWAVEGIDTGDKVEFFNKDIIKEYDRHLKAWGIFGGTSKTHINKHC